MMDSAIIITLISGFFSLIGLIVKSILDGRVRGNVIIDKTTDLQERFKEHERQDRIKMQELRDLLGQESEVKQ